MKDNMNIDEAGDFYEKTSTGSRCGGNGSCRCVVPCIKCQCHAETEKDHERDSVDEILANCSITPEFS